MNVVFTETVRLKDLAERMDSDHDKNEVLEFMNLTKTAGFVCANLWRASKEDLESWAKLIEHELDGRGEE